MSGERIHLGNKTCMSPIFKAKFAELSHFIIQLVETVFSLLFIASLKKNIGFLTC